MSKYNNIIEILNQNRCVHCAGSSRGMYGLVDCSRCKGSGFNFDYFYEYKYNSFYCKETELTIILNKIIKLSI